MIQINRLIGLKRKAQRQGWMKFVRNTSDERAMLNGCWFDIRRAEAPELFCASMIKHIEGTQASKPFLWEPWQRDEFFYPLYGWMRPGQAPYRETPGLRRFQKVYKEVPKKNGKSTESAALALFQLCGDGEPGAQVFCAATDRIQAQIVHKTAQKFVKLSPALSNELSVFRSKYLIQHSDSLSEFYALSSDSNTQQGLNASCIIADEMHSWQGRDLYDCIRWAFSARVEPLFIIITTAGDDLESVCYQEHKYARSILDGHQWDDSYLPIIKTASNPECSLLDETEWYRANPNLGVSIPIQKFRQEAIEALRSTTDTGAFRRYRLNIWTNEGVAWMPAARWATCKRDFEIADLDGRDCLAAADFSRTEDTTSIVLLFPMDDGTLRVVPHFFLPRAVAERQKDRISWFPWEHAGAIHLTDSPVQDLEFIRAEFDKLAERYRILELAFDPWGPADLFAQQVERDLGIPGCKFNQRQQYFTVAVDEVERRVALQTLHHGANPVMDWQMSNVKMRVRGTEKKPIRQQKDDIFKIDGPVSLLMTVARYLELEQAGDDSPTVGLLG